MHTQLRKTYCSNQPKIIVMHAHDFWRWLFTEFAVDATFRTDDVKYSPFKNFAPKTQSLYTLTLLQWVLETQDPEYPSLERIGYKWHILAYKV